MRWLLDTNVISETVRRNPDKGVLAWLAAHPGDDLSISVLTLAELREGVLSLGDKNRQRLFDTWLDGDVIARFGDRILPVTLEILVDWLRLSRALVARGRPRAAADLLIAATARVHDLTIVTRNVRDFARTGVVVYDPWNDRTQIMDASHGRA